MFNNIINYTLLKMQCLQITLKYCNRPVYADYCIENSDILLYGFIP